MPTVFSTGSQAKYLGWAMKTGAGRNFHKVPLPRSLVYDCGGATSPVKRERLKNKLVRLGSTEVFWLIAAAAVG
jgi:hypothetical protein